MTESCVRSREKNRAAYPAVTHSPPAAHDERQGYATMRGIAVRGSSCVSERRRARRQARQEAVEMARDEAMDTAIADEGRGALDGYVLLEAGKMLQRALECEVEVFVSEHADKTDEKGWESVVWNGCLPARIIMTGAGPLQIEQPRVVAISRWRTPASRG
jgi:hypothetical protein